MCPQQSFNHTNNTYLNMPIWRTVSSGSKKVMCTQCRDELSVNEAFEFLRYSENVTTDNFLSLQRDIVELNFLLKSAKRRSMATPAWQQPLYHTAHFLPLSAQYTAPFIDPSNGFHQSKRRESVTCSAVKL